MSSQAIGTKNSKRSKEYWWDGDLFSVILNRLTVFNSRTGEKTRVYNVVIKVSHEIGRAHV